MGDDMDLSMRLFNVLEHVGASEQLRRLHQDTATTVEILTSVGDSEFFGRLINHYYCGSSYEGTVTPDLASDKDIIVCNSSIPVVPDAQLAAPGAAFLIVRDAWTYPGHVKLQWVWNGCPQVMGHEMPSGTELDWNGRMCKKRILGVNMKGPASQCVDEDGVHYLDNVDGFKCQSIPPYALEWFLRERPYRRPSQEKLHEMSRLGCMFVCAGFVYSGERDTEWRLSFTLQERQLMSELTPVQHKVYVLLKVIKKNILGEVFNDETLTSYHCKTCILFAVHMTPARAWTEENLVKCLLQCLKLLIKWLEQGICPNYLIKYQNLFMKEGFTRLRGSLLCAMRLITERYTNFLYIIQSDNIGELLRNGDMRGNLWETSSLKKVEYVVKLKLTTAANIRECSLRSLHGLSRGLYDPFSLMRALDALQRMETINGHSVEVTQSSLSYMYPFVHLHIANALVSLTYRYPAVHQNNMETVHFHFSEASGLDLVNERLARATVLYTSNKYNECFHLLQQIENDFDQPLTLLCPCKNVNPIIYYSDQDKKGYEKKVADMPMNEFIRSSTASCVVFLPSEVEITPVPLQYEMYRSVGTTPGSRVEILNFWFDWAVVDPRIYLYFMQYIVTCKLHKEAHMQVAMYNLRAEIDEDNIRVMAGETLSLNHKDTAYNLLGWLYMQKGLLAEAFVCFAESWKIRPEHNAAKLHMRNWKAKIMSS